MNTDMLMPLTYVVSEAMNTGMSASIEAYIQMRAEIYLLFGCSHEHYKI